MKIIFRNLIIVSSLAAAVYGSSTYVVPNSDKTTEGGQADAALFGPADWTYQWIFDPGAVSAIPVGASITGIGFRLDAGDVNGPSTAITIPNWDLQLSSSPKSVATLGSNFAANIGTDAVTVYNANLTIPVNSFTHAGKNYPFYVINFTTPFVYQGTNLLFTLKRDADPAGTGFWVDGVFPTSPATVSNTAGSGRNNTTGAVDFFVFPVTELVYSAASVPEPSSWLLFGSGLFIILRFARSSRSYAGNAGVEDSVAGGGISTVG